MAAVRFAAAMAVMVIVVLATTAPPPDAALFRIPIADSCSTRVQAGCLPLVLAQAHATKVGAAPVIRQSITGFVRVTFRMVGQSIQRIGISSRSATIGLRQALQRRFVASVCCRRQVQSNIVADDLTFRFPGARIERKVRVRPGADADSRRRREDSPDVDHGFDPDLIDFLIYDQDKPKLVFEGCFEPDVVGRPERQTVFVTRDGLPVQIELEQAELVQACVDFETDEVTYTVIELPPPDR